MNQTDNIGGELKDMRPPTFPTAQRRSVFIPRGGYSHPDWQVEVAWRKWGGETEFVYDVERVGECGLCVFTRGSLGPNNVLAEQVKPFFERHGSESNVFEWDAPAQTFRRINPEWLALYYPTPEQKSGDSV